jgi:hypothetical protein
VTATRSPRLGIEFDESRQLSTYGGPPEQQRCPNELEWARLNTIRTGRSSLGFTSAFKRVERSRDRIEPVGSGSGILIAGAGAENLLSTGCVIREETPRLAPLHTQGIGVDCA